MISSQATCKGGLALYYVVFMLRHASLAYDTVMLAHLAHLLQEVVILHSGVCKSDFGAVIIFL